MGRKSEDWRVRFARFVKPDASGCRLWTGGQDQNGYGMFRKDGQTSHAYRIAYKALRGPVPAGLQLDHLCRVRACVNPAHLEPVTCRVNLLRGETLAARNAAKTHCVVGHEYTPENTRIRQDRSRSCRTCQRANKRATWRRHRAEELHGVA